MKISLAITLLSLSVILRYLPVSTSESTNSPAWNFQNNNYGSNVSGFYNLGPITRINYSAHFDGKNELYTVTPSINHSLTFVSTRQSDGSFTIVPSNGNGSEYSIIQNAAEPLTGSGAFNDPISDWQYGYNDADNNPVADGFEVTYQAQGGENINCQWWNFCTSEMTMWMGLTTNTGSFIQVSIAWGYNGCGIWSDGTPTFSAGWTGPSGSNPHLSNCPMGYSSQSQYYVLSIIFDWRISGEWSFTVYDSTTGKNIVGPTYLTEPTGSWTYDYNMGVVMEGTDGGVDGSWLNPYGQGLYNLLYWDKQVQYFHFVNHGIINTGSDVPTNLGAFFTTSYGGAGSWYYCPTGCQLE